MNNEAKGLAMKFDPHTIEHLGIKMYSKLPNALAELVANGFDADASRVDIYLQDDANDKVISVVDDGIGMEFTEVDEDFLRIGRRKREISGERSVSGRRFVTGRKGLGKLALFGIGLRVTVETTKEGSSHSTCFILDWDEIMKTDGDDYKPYYEIRDCDQEVQGTKVVIERMSRKSPFDAKSLARSLARLFNFGNEEFDIYIHHGDKEPVQVTPKLRYDNIEKQFHWTFPEFLKKLQIDFSYKHDISGKVFSSEKPIPPEQRGIALFAHGRLVNLPEFFDAAESSHAFSYLTGWFDVDFVDEWDEDVIATDRQSLNWEHKETRELREFLKKVMVELEKSWRGKRRNKNRKQAQQQSGINVDKWMSKLPGEVGNTVRGIVDEVTNESQLSPQKQGEVVKSLHTLVPEYPYYHWRHLREEIRDACEKEYEGGDYFAAALEACKQFEIVVAEKTGSPQTGRQLMQETFGSENSRLLLTDNSDKSERNMEDG